MHDRFPFVHRKTSRCLEGGKDDKKPTSLGRVTPETEKD